MITCGYFDNYHFVTLALGYFVFLLHVLFLVSYNKILNSVLVRINKCE